MGRLTDAAAQAGRELKPGPKCSVGKFRLLLTEADRVELDALLADRGGYTSEVIRAALRNEVGAWAEVPAAPTIQRHRTGKCRCESQ